jgi:oxygen-independent coproporphyrinogen-3 oxidase
VTELKKEITKYLRLFRFSGLKTIHIGGGTPNFLNFEQLDEVLRIITFEFPTQNLEELAIEVSPVGLDEDKLRLISSYKFNRISMGIQTFEDSINDANGRKDQKTEKVIKLAEIAKRYFPNVSIDLLAGQKGQTKGSFNRDFETALCLNVNSVFLYQVRQAFNDGGVKEVQALNYFLNYFSSNGYEILSHNHVIKKRNSDGYCEQREGRGRMENLLGIGPGAVSEIKGYVFKNICPTRYLNEEIKIDETSVKLRTERNLRALFLVRSLRYFIRPDINGMLVEDYQTKFGSDPYDDFNHEIDLMRNEGLIKTTPEKIEVTSRGILFTQWIDNYLTKHYK